MTEELITTKEAAKILGVIPRTVNSYRHKYKNFPKPAKVVRGKYQNTWYIKSEIEAYALKPKKRPTVKPIIKLDKVEKSSEPFDNNMAQAMIRYGFIRCQQTP